jgi:hypothetical protein
MAKSVRPTKKSQLIFAFPPTVTREMVTDWMKLRRRYSRYLVFLKTDGVYFTLGIEALITSQLTGQPLSFGEYPLCYFGEADLPHVMTAITDSGLTMAVCHPPDQAEHHLFT